MGRLRLTGLSFNELMGWRRWYEAIVIGSGVMLIGKEQNSEFLQLRETEIPVLIGGIVFLQSLYI